MKKLFIPYIFLALVSCMSTNKLLRQSDLLLHPPIYKYEVSLIKGDSILPERFEDDKIITDFSIDSEHIYYQVVNKTNIALKILWDEVAYIDNGYANKVVRNGVNLINKNDTQPSSIIPPRTAVNGYFTRADLIYFSVDKWEQIQMFTNPIGQTFKVFMPIQYQDQILDYTFNFKVTKSL